MIVQLQTLLRLRHLLPPLHSDWTLLKVHLRLATCRTTGPDRVRILRHMRRMKPGWLSHLRGMLTRIWCALLCFFAAVGAGTHVTSSICVTGHPAT